MCVLLMLSISIISVVAEEFVPGNYSNLCNLPGYSVVAARFRAKQHLLCLKMVPIASSRVSPRIYLDPDLEDTMNEMLELNNMTMALGFPLSAPSAGSAEGYIGDDGHFYGVLHLGNRTLYADPYNRDDPNKGFGPFEYDSFVNPARPRRDYAQIRRFDRPNPMWQIDPTSESTSSMLTARARICDLLLLADKSFFEKDANSSLNNVVRRMVHAVAQADIIFRNTDFDEDGMPDNIGFSVKYILVLASQETNDRVFGDIPIVAGSVDGRSYLMRFARLRRLSEVCLGVAFSGHSFQNRTLGLSFTSLGGGIGGAAGGLCDRRMFGRSFNTLAIAHAIGNGDERVPERIAALTLAHEMGHSFGAHHDDNFPNPQCQGYLMGAQSSSADSPTHFEFSMCSKRLIAAALNTVGYCLYDEARPFCGNGIVEEDEACDCGLPVRCVDRDPCCTPRTGGAEQYEEGILHKGGCAVAPTAACHPSQGPCCTRKCEHANLTKYGIECTRLGQECSCMNPTCRCGLGGRCLSDGSCHAAECAAQGLRECQCRSHAMGGKLKEAKMCGACCVIPGAPGPTSKGRCLPAELAAREMHETRQLSWLHHDYSGPNLTIQLCDDCTPTMIRAWPVDSWCITRNMVGVCSPQAVCVAGIQPRFNVYPDIMSVAMMTRQKLRSSGVRIKASISLTVGAAFLWRK